MIGLAVLLLTQVLTWDDIKKEQGAWDTLTWFAALVMLASFLNELGMVGWFSDAMKSYVSGFSWISAFLILIAVYYYSHYFFASATAHISAMYSAFLAVIIAAGAPPLLAKIKPCVFQQPFCFDNALRSGSGSRLFRGRLYSAKQMVVNRLHLVDCSYCDMACCRRVMVEITGHMVK